MRVLSLFSGGGLGDLGLMSAGMEIVGQVEIDDYCQKILSLRYPETFKWRDIRGVTGKEVSEKVGSVDLVAGGFPCQPFSCSGNQRGDKDNRHLWPEMFRIISEVRPTWVIGENVPGIIGIALDNILHDLEMAGYECGTFVFPSHALEADHRRQRIWIIANANINRLQGQLKSSSTSCFGKGVYADITTVVGQIFRGERNSIPTSWFCRGSDGVPNRVDRLKLLGNGQVVPCTKFIGEIIMRVQNERTSDHIQR